MDLLTVCTLSYGNIKALCDYILQQVFAKSSHSMMHLTFDQVVAKLDGANTTDAYVKPQWLQGKHSSHCVTRNHPKHITWAGWAKKPCRLTRPTQIIVIVQTASLKMTLPYRH